VKVEIVGRGCPVVLANVGPGGFAIASNEMLASVSRREFRFTVPESSWSVVLVAQMAYCLLQPRPSAVYPGRFLTGFTFCDSVAVETRDQIGQMFAT
jgi:hypothetical protein